MADAMPVGNPVGIGTGTVSHLSSRAFSLSGQQYVQRRALRSPGLLHPLWYTGVSTALALWNLLGCYLCYLQIRFRIAAVDEASVEQQALFQTLPRWVDLFSAMAVGGGFLGALALLMRSRLSHPLFLISLTGFVVQFAYALFFGGLLELKGPAAALPKPIFITGIAVLALWISGLARKKGIIRS
ncbi:hypothetical protein [Sphingobium sp. HWE2-09]|uniref:hypothetical protein n=1 Tax=Sphingobium sp. HWE2-09 TaxID=3108390 RepID=UPI002DC7C75E|nr:hypothetical protein [Sphingobium sp. HWE2-09]